MQNSPFKTIRNDVKHWYLLLIVGLLYMCVGIWVFVTPLSSYVALSILFSVSFLVSGISDIVFSVSNRKELDSWGWKLAFGILSTIAGLILFSQPLISITALPLYVGFMALFYSIMAISFSIELRSYGIKNWASVLFIGILGIIFSCIILWDPLFAGLTLVYWTGLAFITVGVYRIIFSIQLNKLRKIVSPA
jgi:uncharacterized membrane protein HdeD (DUF308 family)